MLLSRFVSTLLSLLISVCPSFCPSFRFCSSPHLALHTLHLVFFTNDLVFLHVTLFLHPQLAVNQGNLARYQTRARKPGIQAMAQSPHRKPVQWLLETKYEREQTTTPIRRPRGLEQALKARRLLRETGKHLGLVRATHLGVICKDTQQNRNFALTHRHTARSRNSHTHNGRETHATKQTPPPRVESVTRVG